MSVVATLIYGRIYILSELGTHGNRKQPAAAIKPASSCVIQKEFEAG